jgi:hypothetical protein
MTYNQQEKLHIFLKELIEQMEVSYEVELELLGKLMDIGLES